MTGRDDTARQAVKLTTSSTRGDLIALDGHRRVHRHQRPALRH